jgi:multiple sugar transport system substrate-binding protein
MICSSRRHLLRGAALAAAALAIGAPGSAAAAPESSGVVEIGAALDVGALGPDGTAAERAQLFGLVLRSFEAQHPGIRIRYYPLMQGIGTMGPAILAGRAPDVFPDCCTYGEYASSGLLLRLDAFLKADNVDMSIWSPSQVATFDTGYGTYALSRNVDSYAFAVRLDVLDALGLPYPDAGWTYQDLAQLAAATTAPSTATKPKRFGLGYQDGYVDLLQIVPGFGGHTTAGGRMRQVLSEPPGLAAGRWMFEQLFWPGVATPSTSWTGSSAPNLGNGQLVIQEFQINQLLPSFQAWGQTFKWAFFPPPTYTVRPANPVSNDFWAISATSRHPEEAWLLLKWLSAGETFQRFMMKTFLFSPALNALWEEWQATVEAAVPGLRGRGLHWFATAAQKGWGTPQPYFRYASAGALAIDAQAWTDLLARRVGVDAALRSADRQVNALVAAAAQEQAAAQALRSLFPTVGPPIAPAAAGI